MSDQFLEYQHHGTLYRVEQDTMSRDWRAIGYTKVEGHKDKLGVSCMIRDCDVDEEIRDIGLSRTDFQTRAHAALRMAILRLEPQIKYHIKKLRGDDELDPIGRMFDPFDPDMDEQLADALVNGKPDWVVEDQRREAEIRTQREKERAQRIADALRQKEEAELQARLAEKRERERLQRERDTMESCELWGAF